MKKRRGIIFVTEHGVIHEARRGRSVGLTACGLAFALSDDRIHAAADSEPHFRSECCHCRDRQPVWLSAWRQWSWRHRDDPDRVACPNCGTLMHHFEKCPSCPHDDREVPWCDCPACKKHEKDPESLWDAILPLDLAVDLADRDVLAAR